MLHFLKKLFQTEKSPDFKVLVESGAKIIDVRTRQEFSSGHFKGSINIPLQEITSGLKQLNKEDIIITCCRSGMRSASAKSILKENGYQFVYNGGSWNALESKLNYNSPVNNTKS